MADAVRATGREVYLDLGLTGYAAVREVDEYPAATPTLLVRGEHDAPSMLAPIYADLCATNPVAREVVLPGTGHIPMLDAPDALDEAIAGLLADLPPR